MPKVRVIRLVIYNIIYVILLDEKRIGKEQTWTCRCFTWLRLCRRNKRQARREIFDMSLMCWRSVGETHKIGAIW